MTEFGYKFYNNEHVDLSTKLPDVVKKLQDRVQYHMKALVPPLKKPPDPKAIEVAQEKGYWGPWRSESTVAASSSTLEKSAYYPMGVAFLVQSSLLGWFGNDVAKALWQYGNKV